MQPDQQGVFFQVTVIGSQGGVFLYDNSNNLVDSMAFQSGVDPVTLSNVAGIASYDPSTGRITQIQAAAFQLIGGTGTLILATRPASIKLNDALAANLQPSMDLAAPATQLPAAAFSLIRLLGESQDSSLPAQVLIALSPGGLPASKAVLEIQSTVATGRLDAVPAATAPPARPAGTEPWNAMTPLLNGWANVGAPAPVAQYRLVASPPASVEIIGSMLSAGSTASTIFTLPAAYRPTHTIRFPVELIVGTAPAAGTNMFGSVAATGTVGLFNIPTVAGDTVDFHALIPLDA